MLSEEQIRELRQLISEYLPMSSGRPGTLLVLQAYDDILGHVLQENETKFPYFNKLMSGMRLAVRASKTNPANN